MDLRVLRSFLVLTKEKTISKAAKALYMTQPNLSRQLADLEKEVGCTLFLRDSRRIVLTDEGEYFKRQAQRIVDLADGALDTLRTFEEKAHGTVRVACEESIGLDAASQAMGLLAARHETLRFQLLNRHSYEALELVDRREIDFCAVADPVDVRRYRHLQLPGESAWGILARKDSRLAMLDCIRPNDLADVPIVCPIQALRSNWLTGWLPNGYGDLRIVATYDLAPSGQRAVENGIGYALCPGRPSLNIPESGPLCFRELAPRVSSRIFLVWNDEESLSPAAELFLETLKDQIAER